jgi:hypothetical protein
MLKMATKNQATVGYLLIIITERQFPSLLLVIDMVN